MFELIIGFIIARFSAAPCFICVCVGGLEVKLEKRRSIPTFLSR